MTRVQGGAVAAGFAGLLWAAANVFTDGFQVFAGQMVVLAALAVFNIAEWRR